MQNAETTDQLTDYCSLIVPKLRTVSAENRVVIMILLLLLFFRSYFAVLNTGYLSALLCVQLLFGLSCHGFSYVYFGVMDDGNDVLGLLRTFH